MSEKKNRLIAIVGPTAVGKTSYALHLAPTINAEIVSADSRQVFEGMDIATGKEADQGRWIEFNGRRTLRIGSSDIHGLDLAQPNQPFSVAEWRTAVIPIIEEIMARQHVPLIVGGTGLYLAALEGHIATIDTPPNAALRRRVADWPMTRLQRTAEKNNPDAWQRMTASDRQNPIRLIRALETATSAVSGSARAFSLRYLGLTRPRNELYGLADARVDRMVDLGLVEETRRLLATVGPNHQSMTGIGYQEITAYLRGELSIETAISRMKFRIHSYIRRQETWWRKRAVTWIDTGEENWRRQADAIIAEWLKNDGD
jgi:tRNA dimethylallyltransferase